MLSIPGTEALSPALKYLIAFAIIFVLLALFALVLRRLTGGRLSSPAQGGRSRQPRLGIVDVYDLDRQRQLILLRRDNVEHLLLIGGPNDVIVETNIVRTPGARLPTSPTDQTDRAEPVVDRSLEAQPRPSVEPLNRPEPVVARLGLADPGRPGAEPAARNGQSAIPPEPFLKPDVVALSAAAPALPPRPAPQPVREAAPPPVREVPQLRDPPPPQPVREPPPQPVVQRAALVKAAPQAREPIAAPEPQAIRAAPEPPRQPPQPPAPARQGDGGDSAVLSNMAKQLEEALKRPLSGGKPGPAPAPNGPVATADDRLSRPAPTRIAHAAPAPAAASQSVRQPESHEPAPQKPRPMPAPVTKMRPEPDPANARPGAATEPAPSGAGEGGDPFSVEEIEAEFARLLGRPLDPRDRPH